MDPVCWVEGAEWEITDLAAAGGLGGFHPVEPCASVCGIGCGASHALLAPSPLFQGSQLSIRMWSLSVES